MLRWRGLVVAACAVVALGFPWSSGSSAARARATRSGGRSPRLTLFYTPPVLVRAGERVVVPVDLVCATSSGAACRASLSVGEADGARNWTTTRAGATHQRDIDLTNAATRAASSGGSVRFSFVATSGSATLRYPQAGRGSLRFYVVRDLPRVPIPSIPFGRVARGRTVLFLPWGSGPMRAGLSPSHESPTLGPASFDVDPAGRILIVDPPQDRMAIYHHGVLLSETPVALTASSDAALAASGEVYVADRGGDRVTVRRIDRTGAIADVGAVQGPLFGQIRMAGRRPYVNVLPEDVWVGVDNRGSVLPGRPFGDGAVLLRRGGLHTIRLGAVVNGHVVGPVELATPRSLGEVAFAEMRRPGDYWVVAHPYEERPVRADQFQVIHIVDGRIDRTFAVADDSFADQRPFARFRMAGDALYQMVTSPDGVRIVRYDMGRES